MNTYLIRRGGEVIRVKAFSFKVTEDKLLALIKIGGTVVAMFQSWDEIILEDNIEDDETNPIDEEDDDDD